MIAARLLTLLPFLLVPRVALAQFEDQKLLPGLPVIASSFGTAIDADDGRAIVGAHGPQLVQGRAYVFERTGSAWSQVARFDEDLQTGSKGFGTSVSLAGDFAAVGAPMQALAGGGTGMAYIYERNGGVWTEVAQVFPSDGQPGDEFGSSVALDGNTLFVGSNMAGPLLREGAVYVFERIAGSWVETQKLEASNGAVNDRFGSAIELDGTTAVVGAPFESNQDGVRAGRVYVFEHDGTSWMEVQKIRANAGVQNGFFGEDLALEGDTLMVATRKGRVDALERTQGTFHEVDQLLPDPSHSSYGFGLKVALSGNHALVGAADTLLESSIVGSALLYERQQSGWTLVNEVVASDRGASDRFGGDVAFDGSTMLIGADGDDDVAIDSGALYSFSPSLLDADLYCFCDAPTAPCAFSVPFAGCAAGVIVRGTRLEAVGSTSLARDDFVLLASDMLPNAFCLFFMGAAQTETTFGNGLRCVDSGGSGLFRFPVQNSGPERLAQLGPGIGAHTLANFNTAGQIQPGDRWNFQLWYRDNPGFCGAGFNTSNAVSAVFSN